MTRLLVGCCLLLALPEFCVAAEDQQIRSHAADAWLILSGYKGKIAEYHRLCKTAPTSNKEIGLPEPTAFKSSAIKELRVMPNGALSATLSEASGYKGATIQLVPNMPAPNAKRPWQWSCISPDVESIESWKIFPAVEDINTWMRGCKYQPGPGGSAIAGQNKTKRQTDKTVSKTAALSTSQCKALSANAGAQIIDLDAQLALVRAREKITATLLSAIDDGNVDGVRDALRRGGEPNSTRSIWALSKAVLSGDIEIIKLLLDAGADPNLCQEDESFSCVQLAITYDFPHFSSVLCGGNCSTLSALRLKLLALLINAGANPNLRPNAFRQYHHGELSDSPLTAAIKSGDVPVADFLVRAGAKLQDAKEHFVAAAERSDAEMIAWLLDAGLSFDKSADRALWVAVQKNCAACVRTLLRAGAKFDLTRGGEFGSKAAWFDVIVNADAEVLDVLWTHGLNIKAVDTQAVIRKENFLHMVARAGRADAVNWFVQHGVAVDASTEHGATPLMYAAMHGNLDAVRILLDAKASVAKRDNWGKTAKVLAAENGHTDVVSLLASRGAKEYAGSTIPSIFHGLLFLQQWDVTGDVYKQLPFLEAGLRFFTVSPTAFSNTGPYFAVLPDETVVKLDSPDAYFKLNIRLKSKEHALQFVRGIPIPSLVETRFVHRGMYYMELPIADRNSCIGITESRGKTSIAKPTVEKIDTDSEKSFVVTRYLLPIQSLDFGTRNEVASLFRVVERVSQNGKYMRTKTEIATPGLMVENHCSIR